MLPLALLPMLGAALAAFDPSQLTGMVAWGRSDVATVAAGRVTVLGDKSGNGNTWVPLNTVGPLYSASDAAFNGLPSLQYDALSALKSVNNLTYGPFSMFFAVAIPVTLASSFIFDRGSNPQDSIRAGTTTTNSTVVARAGGIASKQSPAGWYSSATCMIISFLFDGTFAGMLLRLNGVTQVQANGTFGTANPGAAVPAALPAFLFSGGSGAQLLGKQAEVIIYDNNLSLTNAAKVETYMKQRYGVA